MDKRKRHIEKQEYFLSALNSDEVNLEIARKLKELNEQEQLIKYKASQGYEQRGEEHKLLTVFSSQKTLEGSTKSIYVMGFFIWFILYRQGSNWLKSFVEGVTRLRNNHAAVVRERQ